VSARGGRAELPAGLRRAYVLTLALPALLAPIPLYFTDGASAKAIALYEAALLFLWWRARRGRAVRLPDLVLNLAGLAYFLLLAFEISVLHHGLLRCVSNLLLFTALAKLASLKSAGEARTALLVLFLLTLAAASSSTHVSSLLYFAAMALAAFQALARLAVLADFDDAPPDRVLRAIPTPAVSAAGIAGAAVLCVPLFYGLPRLKGPYAIAPFRLDDSFSTTLAADRVDLESFGAAKRSDRVVLRLTADPADANRVVRLREAVFTQYRDGTWTRGPSTVRPGRGVPKDLAPQPGRPPVRIDLNLFAKGFLFLPYGVETLRLGEGRSAYPLGDGLIQASPGRRTVSYEVGLGRPAAARAPGRGAIDPEAVPREIREYAAQLVGEERNSAAVYRLIESHLRKNFVYTLDPPEPRGDPLTDFLLRTRAGHCEYFASAAAMMLAARGVPARLVTGSYGGEVGLFSRSIVVRGGNLHAWVEADLDGTGFAVLDPTPASGVPPASTSGSLLRSLASLGREIEFFYDRRILGFESLDQQRALDAARERLSRVAESASGWKGFWSAGRGAIGRLFALIALGGGLALLVREWIRRRRRLPPATKAYLALRGLLARRVGFVSPATPPAEIARRFGEAVPGSRGDADALVATYCASAFGGREADGQIRRELEERLRRLRKLA
jgi:transglutaminase-like putative cysteine protease